MLTIELFIEKAKKKHGDKYNYSLVELNKRRLDGKILVTIICPKHGSWEQTTNNHLSGCGCKQCAIDTNSKRKLKSTELFIEEARQKYNNKYDYSLVNYIKGNKKIKIVCPEHGIFTLTPETHLSERGCKHCKKIESLKIKELNFIKNSNELHDNIYDYSLVEYRGYSNHKVKIICPNHGIFLQTPDSHLTAKNGCPKCRATRGENKIRNWLLLNDINFETEKRFKECKFKRALPFDFFLPEHNTCIEYDGEGHFKDIKWSSSTNLDLLEATKFRDSIKDEYCNKNNIRLLRIPYWDFKNIPKILSEFLSLS